MLTDASLQVVCDFCEKHLEANKQAFADPRLHLIIDDARAQLEKAEGPFDVIIGDLADPVFGGPCYQVQPPDIPLASRLVQALPCCWRCKQQIPAAADASCTGGTACDYGQHFLTWDEFLEG